MSFSSLNLLVFQSSDSGLLRSASSASILKFEGEVEADGLDKEKEQHGPHGILSHLKSLTFGAKTMWRLLFCSFFQHFPYIRRDAHVLCGNIVVLVDVREYLCLSLWKF